MRKKEKKQSVSKGTENLTQETAVVVATPKDKAVEGTIDPTGDETGNFEMVTVEILPGIEEHTYLNEEFVWADESITQEEIFDLADTVDGFGENGLLPKLKAEIEEVIGKDNSEFSGIEIGIQRISFNWLVNARVHGEVMKRLAGWLNYVELGDVINLRTGSSEKRDWVFATLFFA